jgi:hypothetical protein
VVEELNRLVGEAEQDPSWLLDDAPHIVLPRWVNRSFNRMRPLAAFGVWSGDSNFVLSFFRSADAAACTGVSGVPWWKFILLFVPKVDVIVGWGTRWFSALNSLIRFFLLWKPAHPSLLLRKV